MRDMPTGREILGEVFRSPDLASIFVVPFRHVDAIDVLVRLQQLLPGATMRRTARGIELNGASAFSLSAMSSSPFKWSAEATRYVANRRAQQEMHVALVDHVKRISAGGRKVAADYLADDPRLNVLDEHQWVNVAAMTVPNSPGLCLFDEQGAGKTVSMIYAFDELVHRNEVDFMLIVAPKSMVGEWPKDIARFMNDTYRVAIAEGSLRQKVATLQGRPDVLITNFETAVSLERELDAFLRSHDGRAVLAVDESFFIKSPDAKRTLALRRLREACRRAYVLCGTPAPNSPADLVQQFSFVDFGVAFDGVSIPEDRDAAFPIVQTVVEERGLYIRNLKANVLPDLPPKSFQKVSVKMEARQASLYRSALAALARDLNDATDLDFNRRITTFLSQRSMLLQICSNPAAASDSYDAVPAKILALDSILEQLIAHQNEKVIVWSFYTHTIDMIMARFPQYGAVRYDGSVTSVAERQAAVSRFQTDSTTMLFVANPAAAGAGLTLHSARVAIYESMSNQAAHYLQSLDRIHRRGQQRDVEYLILLCENSVEEVEYQRLLRKEQSAQSLLGDGASAPIMRTTMLEETLRLLEALDTEEEGINEPSR